MQPTVRLVMMALSIPACANGLRLASPQQFKAAARQPEAGRSLLKMSASTEVDCLVLGGGISGSTLAHNLHRKGIDVLLTEARDYLGGNVKSHNKDGFIWEEGPNSFATQPSIVRIAYEVGHIAQLPWSPRPPVRPGASADRECDRFPPVAGHRGSACLRRRVASSVGEPQRQAASAAKGQGW